MLRLTEIKLPLDHTAEALRALVLRTLGIAAADLLGVRVRRRGHFFRNPTATTVIYTIVYTLTLHFAPPSWCVDNGQSK